MKELLLNSKLQLVALKQGHVAHQLLCSNSASSDAASGLVWHAAPAARAYLPLLLCSMRSVAAAGQQLVLTESGVGSSRSSSSSWWRGWQTWVCVQLGNAAAALLQLRASFLAIRECHAAAEASRTPWQSNLMVLYSLAFLVAMGFLIALVGVTVGKLSWVAGGGLAVAVIALYLATSIIFVNNLSLYRLLCRVVCGTHAAKRAGLGWALELSLLQYENMLLWQHIVTEQAAPVAAAAGACTIDAAAFLDQLPKRLTKLPDQGLPAAAAEQLEHFGRKWPVLLSCRTADPQQQQQQELVQQLVDHEQQLQLASEFVELFQLILAEVPSPLGCNNPACGNLDGLSELEASKQECSGCRVACYCSEACQKAHWMQHKAACGRLRATASSTKSSSSKAASKASRNQA